MVLKYGMDRPVQGPLTEKLSPGGPRSWPRSCKDMGSPANAFDKFDPYSRDALGR